MYKDRDLIVSEVECKALKEVEVFQFLGKDITSDSGYKKSNLAINKINKDL